MEAARSYKMLVSV